MIKSLTHGCELFRHAGGSSETPVCGGEISVCVSAWAALSTPTKQLKEDFVGYLYTLWQAVAFAVEKLIHAGVEADCAASGRRKIEVHEDN